ncbi:MAG: tetratricopeptide repeat protein [Sulfuriferula sp.]|nr:tetratricopeptide repeat protein [Sulfuriferula sp.]
MISKIANAVVWGGLTLLLVALIYKYTDWIKPAVDHGVASVKTVVASVPTGPFGKADNEANLDKARDAFAKGDVEGSIAAYQAYLKDDTSNADARGELGNVYYLNGRLPEAAQAYYDAAKLLIAQNHPERVPALLPIIGQVNPSLANELVQKMTVTSAPATDTQPAPVQQAPQSATGYY